MALSSLIVMRRLGHQPGVRKDTKEATCLQEKLPGRTEILQEVAGLFQNCVFWLENGYQEPCTMPTVKQPDCPCLELLLI